MYGAADGNGQLEALLFGEYDGNGMSTAAAHKVVRWLKKQKFLLTVSDGSVITFLRFYSLESFEPRLPFLNLLKPIVSFY